MEAEGYAYERHQLASYFGTSASYVLLHEGSKLPRGSYSPRKASAPKALKKTPPARGNFGVLSQDLFFMLDLDNHKKNIVEQVALFTQLLGVDLSTALEVTTPSGGRHFYLRPPEGFDMTVFFNGSLRSYREELKELSGLDVSILDADVRSWISAGYVVAPGSHSAKEGNPRPEDYYAFTPRSLELLSSSTVQELPRIAQKAGEIFAKLGALQVAKRRGTPRPKKLQDTSVSTLLGKPQEAQEDTWSETEELLGALPTQRQMKLLRDGLHKKYASRELSGLFVPFHQKRAFIASALLCCYSDHAIYQTWRRLSIDRDTYRNAKLSPGELRRDVQKLRERSGKFEHTVYCPRRSKKRREMSVQGAFSPTKQRAQVAARSLARLDTLRRVDPRVVDVAKIVAHLTSRSRGGKATQVIQDAVALIDFFVQPLANSGAMRMVLAQAALTKHLSLSSSRASAALRLLRKEEVLVLVDKQRTGLAATYDVTEPYTHMRFTRTLRALWTRLQAEQGHAQPIYFDRFTGAFRNVFTNGVLQEERRWHLSDGAYVRSLVAGALPLSQRMGAALLYNREAARLFGLTITQDEDGEFLVAFSSTGELVSEDSLLTPLRQPKVRYLKGREPRARKRFPFIRPRTARVWLLNPRSRTRRIEVNGSCFPRPARAPPRDYRGGSLRDLQAKHFHVP